VVADIRAPAAPVQAATDVPVAEGVRVEAAGGIRAVEVAGAVRPAVAVIPAAADTRGWQAQQYRQSLAAGMFWRTAIDGAFD
jgi:hypothetical protein